MVVRCVAQMVQAKASNIRSGWKNIFFVLSLAASDTDPGIVQLAFTTATHIFEQCFSKVTDHRAALIAASFMDAVNCLTEFACNPNFVDLNMLAIRHLRLCASTVAEFPTLFVNPSNNESSEPQIWVRGWFPILFGLSRVITRCKMDVRTRALTVMFEIMKTYGSNFLSEWWTDLFRIVFRIFDGKKLSNMSSEQEKIEWMSTTCTHALRSIIDVVSQFFSNLENCVIDELFSLLRWCIQQENEQLARTGTECLHILVMSNGFSFQDSTWELAVTTISNLFEDTAPRELYLFSPIAETRNTEQLSHPENEQQLHDVNDGDVAETISANSFSEQSISKEDAASHKADASPSQSGFSDSQNEKESTEVKKTHEMQRHEETQQLQLDIEKQPQLAVSEEAATNGPKHRHQGVNKSQGCEDTTVSTNSEVKAQRLSTKEQRSIEKQHQQRLFNAIVIKSVVQLELIQTIEWIVLSSTKPVSQVVHSRTVQGVLLTPTHRSGETTSSRQTMQENVLNEPLDDAGEMFERLTSARLLVLLDCLLRSHAFAQEFNANMDLRTRLWKAGFMKNRSKPNLLKQETTALGCALRIMFRIYEAPNREDVFEDVESRIFSTVSAAFDHFLTNVPSAMREVWTPLMCLILRELLALSDDRFKRHAEIHYTSVTECITLAYDTPLGKLCFLLASFFQRTRTLQISDQEA